MLGQAQTTSLFFSGQRLEAGTLSFPPHPYTFAVQKERLSDGVKDTEMGSRMTGKRQGKGMDNEKGVQHVHRNRHKLSAAWRRSVYGASLRVGNAAVPGTHIMSIRISGGR